LIEAKPTSTGYGRAIGACAAPKRQSSPSSTKATTIFSALVIVRRGNARQPSSLMHRESSLVDYLWTNCAFPNPVREFSRFNSYSPPKCSAPFLSELQNELVKPLRVWIIICGGWAVGGTAHGPLHP
jgi:hypothetical protein